MALVLLTIGCSSAPVSTTAATAPDTHDADVKAIRDDETQWASEWASKNGDKILAHYTDDAVVMNPGMPAMNGRESSRQPLKELLSDPALDLKFTAAKVDVSKSGDMGYAQGPYTMTMTIPGTKKVIHDKGSFVTVYKKQADGSWKAVQDIASSEMPPGAPPAK